MPTTRWKKSAGLALAIALLLYLLAGWNMPALMAVAQTDHGEQAAQALLANRYSVTAGAAHTCALTGLGGAKCWGSNASGQLGLGTTTEQDTPVALSGLIAHVTALAAGNEHTCAFANATGAVQCWGSNAHGQLGDGGLIKQRLAPSDSVALPNPAAQIATGGEHTCALLLSGAVYCWGNNASGQLNGVASGDSASPIPANYGDGIATQIAAGAAHTCALLQTGQVRCWGDNTFGQLGATDNGAGPVTVSGLPANVVMIAAGAWHTCALIGKSDVWCWGRNDSGQLGNSTGAQDSQANPIQVQGLSGNLSLISLGERHSCAVRNGGRVLCWGNNADGALGNNTDNDSATAVEAAGLRNAQTIAAGGQHTCALLIDGGMRCWGRNFNGQLGNGENGRHVLPVSVINLGSNVLSMVTASNHTCARLGNGDVKCWGLNDSGQLGDGTRLNRNAPVSVQALPFGVRILTADGHHTCVAATFAAYCWGSNSDGQLGDGTTQNRLTPVQVLDLGANISAMVIGDLHTCALLFNGGVRCWGDNTYGQLGDGSTQDRNRPVAVVGLGAPATSISAGAKHSCARLNTGVVKCWGDNGFGQLGNGSQESSLTPITVKGFENGGAAAVNASETHTCARLSNSSAGAGMQCWGNNAFGQLGDGTNTDSFVPVAVAGLSDVSGISVGRFHTCAMNGGVFECWGNNQFGQLGDGGLANRNVPEPVSNLNGNINGYGAGGGQTCAIVGNGMRCWGSDQFGQIGDGSPVDQLSAVAVLDFDEPQPDATDTPIAQPTATLMASPSTTALPGTTTATATATSTPPNTSTRTPTPTGEVLPPHPSVSYLPVVLKQVPVFFEGPSEVEPNNNSGEPNGPLRAGRVYTGLPNDSDDYFSFNVTQSGPVKITLSNHIAESTRNLQLQLRDSNDASLGFVFQAPFVIERTLPPGKYYIRVFYAPPGPYDNTTPYSLQVDFQ